jgi:hypothetical protein
MSTVYDVTVSSGNWNEKSNVEVSLIILGDKGSSSTIAIKYPPDESKGKRRSILVKKIIVESNDVGKVIR